MAKANANGIMINYDDIGSGVPIILLHGFPLRSDMWAGQREFLSRKGFRVITPDLRGFGQSEYKKINSMGDFSDDIAGLMNHLGIEKAVVGGMSMGGYVLLNLLERYPSRILSSIFIVTRSEADTDAGKEKRAALAEKVRSGLKEAIADAFVPILFDEASYVSKTHLVNQIKDWILTTNSETLIDSLLAMRDRKDYLSMLKNFVWPSLVIGSRGDRTIPLENSEKIAGGLPHAQMVALPRGGHMVNMEEPDLFNNTLFEFLQNKSFGV